MYMEMYIWEESKAGRERCPTPEFQPQLLGIAKGIEPPLVSSLTGKMGILFSPVGVF